MITLERTKELLNDPKLSDLEAQDIRNAFYSLADLVFDNWSEKN